MPHIYAHVVLRFTTLCSYTLTFCVHHPNIILQFLSCVHVEIAVDFFVALYNEVRVYYINDRVQNESWCQTTSNISTVNYSSVDLLITTTLDPFEPAARAESNLPGRKSDIVNLYNQTGVGIDLK